MTNPDASSPALAESTPDTRRSAADGRAAAGIAAEAGALLLAHRTDQERIGADPSDVRKAGDRLSHEFLVATLGRRFPGDAVLSEEGADDPARLAADRVWIVDPLDGTREFGEPGRSDWAVHVALVEAGRLVAGAVALPGLGVTFSTADTVAPLSALPAVPRVVVSRTRRPAPVTAMAEALGAELIEMGSAGAKAMAVVRGEADVYAHTGGQYEWDSAAPVAVARAAGLHVSRIDGSELRYNQENPWLPDLLICRPELADRALGVLGR
ncbi:3'(2'),5'-bisphosphate nucleotidase CysQ [Streptomyces endophyticus]|uniref:3'(2'),5'-bisphosphate nucleotidase CysQ n=1 Tax=Streptomyces endophyticus TaxID=714166 RepID=A0ABU6F6B2_9ACTN|nr:3'(2'),5'-bisphosphate nucleotidase CysQ [Streptomyces endophyticus]MEB8339563.1 3'(2'),5'-bisphosphate nucleotidase CysQ [Streptomyces endophyticus]